MTAVLAGSAASAQASPVEVVEVRKIWDLAPHNAFTSLVRFRGRWYCTFREGTAHVSPDGAARVIASDDGEQWESVALLKSELGDVRDPKLTVTPDQRLMLNTAVALTSPIDVRHQSLAWFSADGKQWGEPVKVADPGFWLWRVTWQERIAYGVGYLTSGTRFIRLYQSRDGRQYETLVDRLYDHESPGESSIVFLNDSTALCLLRLDAGKFAAQLGRAKPPYTEWEWKDLGVRIGGPLMMQLPDGRLLAAVRLHTPKVHTGLCWVDATEGKLTEFLELPSGGDTSYAGMVLHEGLLWTSYYSSHEGKTSIYLAKVRLPDK